MSSQLQQESGTAMRRLSILDMFEGMLSRGLCLYMVLQIHKPNKEKNPHALP